MPYLTEAGIVELPLFELHLSEKRKLDLLGTAPGTPNTSPLMAQAMLLVMQVLKAWVRLMATLDASHLPPMIHNLQVADGVPHSLVRCSTLSKMWVEQNSYTAALVGRTLLDEVETLLDQVGHPESQQRPQLMG
jgi:hypothetical protein